MAQNKEALEQMVFVSNISKEADVKTIEDFFSFCGKISDITLNPDSADATLVTATIRFESQTAARTALLLTKAYIQDRAITVKAYAEILADADDEAAKKVPDTAPEVPVQEAPRTAEPEKSDNAPPLSQDIRKGAASILATTYIVGSDTTKKASELSDQLGITDTYKETAHVVAQATEKTKEKLSELDEAIGVSTVTKSAVDMTSSGLKVVDEALHISDGYKAVTSMVAESETMKKTSGWFKSSWSSMKSAWGEVQDEAIKDVEKERPDVAEKMKKVESHPEKKDLNEEATSATAPAADTAMDPAPVTEPAPEPPIAAEETIERVQTPLEDGTGIPTPTLSDRELSPTPPHTTDKKDD